MDILDSSTLTTVQTPASISASGNSAGVDCRSLCQHGAVILTALKTAGTNPTLAIKLQHAPDGDIVTSVTPGSNTGNGTCTQVYGGPDSVAENITITFTSATAFGVTGSVSGAMAAGTVGTLYKSAICEFMITAGSTAFINGDTIVIVTTARTYADVDGGGFTGLTTAASIQKKSINFDEIGRYLRANYVIGGTNSPAYTVGIAALSLAN